MGHVGDVSGEMLSQVNRWGWTLTTRKGASETRVGPYRLALISHLRLWEVEWLDSMETLFCFWVVVVDAERGSS